MLTLDLVRVKISDYVVRPCYIDTENERYAQSANAIIKLYEKCKGKSKGVLDEAVNDFIAESREVNFCRGINKLLEDRSDFGLATTIEIEKVRQTVFEISSEFHKEGRYKRESVLEKASGRLGLTPEQIARTLFADLKQNQVLQDFKPITPQKLLTRYNTSLAQAVLLRATQMEIQINEKDHLRYRQLFRAVKFYRLLYLITGDYQQGFSIKLDGPMSLFNGCQKYGLQMALFLPALLLCKNWQLEAHLNWKKFKSTCYFRLNDQDQLISHYPDTGMYMPPELTVFKEKFKKLKSPWKMNEECDFLALTSQSICIPDCIFIHKNGQKIFLEIFGFWRKSALEKRLEELKQYKKPMLIAVSKNLGTERDETLLENPHIYWFHEVINAKKILQYLNGLIELYSS